MEINFKFNLQPLKRDSRDYSHSATFGVVSDIPKEYSLVSTILNQGNKNACTAYASNAIAESRFGVKFDPEWFFQQEAIVNGSNNSYGYDLRVPMKTGKDVGFKKLDGGEIIKEGGYFSVGGFGDLFSEVQQAMWSAKDEKRCINAGVMFYREWLNQGVIQTGYKIQLGNHDVKIAGWKQISGVDYMIIQNSFGTQYGDNGLHYFTRELFNKCFREGMFMWRTVPDYVIIQKIGLLLSLYQQLLRIVLRMGTWINS